MMIIRMLHLINRPLIPCYEAEDLIRPWWTYFWSLPVGHVWFKSRGIL